MTRSPANQATRDLATRVGESTGRKVLALLREHGIPDMFRVERNVRLSELRQAITDDPELGLLLAEAAALMAAQYQVIDLIDSVEKEAKKS